MLIDHETIRNQFHTACIIPVRYVRSSRRNLACDDEKALRRTKYHIYQVLLIVSIWDY